MSEWPYPRLIAHRGGGVLAPENTLAALNTAVAHGYHGVEFDVMLSANGTPVVIHDETLERTTNGHGLVGQTQDVDLARLDAGSWYSSQFVGEPLPLFSTFGARCVALGLWANVEIKPASTDSKTEAETGYKTAKLASQIWQRGSGARLSPPLMPPSLLPSPLPSPSSPPPLPPLLSSFSTTALQAAREAAPQLPRGLLYDNVPSDWVQTLTQLGCVSLHCNARHATVDLIVEARERGIPIALYTVNDLQAIQDFFQQGVSAIFTDQLALAAPLLRRFKQPG